MCKGRKGKAPEFQRILYRALSHLADNKITIQELPGKPPICISPGEANNSDPMRVDIAVKVSSHQTSEALRKQINIVESEQLKSDMAYAEAYTGAAAYYNIGFDASGHYNDSRMMMLGEFKKYSLIDAVTGLTSKKKLTGSCRQGLNSLSALKLLCT